MKLSRRRLTRTSIKRAYWQRMKSSLETSLSAYWKLDEASGNRIDASGRSNTLSVVGTAVGNEVGLVNTAATFLATDTDYLQMSSTPDVSLQAGKDFTAYVIFKPTTSSNNFVFSKSNGGHLEYSLNYNGNQLKWAVFNDTTNLGEALTNITLGLNEQFIIFCEYQWSTRAVKITVNSIEFATVTATGDPVPNVTYPFAIGARANTAAAGFFYNGNVDEFGIWHRLLNDAEKQWLDNGRAGQSYPFTAYNPRPSWNYHGAIISADNNGVGETNVIYEGSPQILTGETNVFKLWYTFGWSSIAVNYAESADGVTWTQYSSNPTNLAGGRPYIIKVGTIYYAYVCVDTAFHRYSSSDGLTWAQDTLNVLTLGTAGAWDDNMLGNLCVWKEDTNDWRMLYEAKKSNTNWKIGYATSSNGTTWSKSASNPVLTTGGMVGGPHIIKSGGTYYLWAHASVGGSLPTDIWAYSSADLITWTRRYKFPVLPRNDVNSGYRTAVGQIADPYILVVGDTAYCYYSAGLNGNLSTRWEIRLATIDASLLTT